MIVDLVRPDRRGWLRTQPELLSSHALLPHPLHLSGLGAFPDEVVVVLFGVSHQDHFRESEMKKWLPRSMLYVLLEYIHFDLDL